MIVTITGYPGSGKSTLGKGLANALGLKHYSAGDLLRQIAKEKGLDLIQLQKEMEKDKSIDKQLDKRTEDLGKKQDNFVIDGRLAWHFIPKSLKIFVKADLKKAAERVYQDIKKGEKSRHCEKQCASPRQVEQNMRQRMKMNQTRYKKLYSLDYLNEKNYDIVVDTTNSGIEGTREKVLKQVKQYLSKR